MFIIIDRWIMAKRIIFCPRCMNIIHRKDEKCSSCGLEVSKMQEMKESQEAQKNATKISGEENEGKENPVKDDASVEEEEVKQQGILVDTSSILNGRNSTKADSSDSIKEFEEAMEDDKKQDLADGSEQNRAESYIDSSEIGVVNFEENPDNASLQNKPKRHKHKSKIKKEDQPKYTVDSDGSYNIDTSDVTYLEGIEAPTYSVRKARGDAPKEEKLKWWEIYKWADRMLAKRKIMKEVRKASHKRPEGIKKSSMLLWCLFFGWLGIHNFYAKNNKKGWTIVIFDIIIGLVINIQPLYEFMGVFVGGGLGFVVLAMWLYDLCCLIIDKYRYRISKEEFISNLNVETRSKLGKKYVAFDRSVFKEKEKARLEKLNKKKEKRRKNING